MTQNKKRPSSQKWLATLLYALLGATAGALNMRYIFGVSQKPGAMRILLFVVLVAGVYIAMLAQTVIHEAGHLVFGLLTGYRFSSFRIHNWMWIKENGKIRFRRLSIPGTGGQCLMGPPDLKDGKIPFLLYNFGGAIMNLLTAALFLFLSAFLRPDSILKLFLQMLTLFGVGLAVTNGLPMHIGLVDNDGCNALTIFRSRKAMRAFWIQMKANELSARGVRLKDMPEEWFIQPEEWYEAQEKDMDNGLMTTVGVLTCNRLMDQHRFDEADALMEHMLSVESRIVDVHRSLLICDRVFLELIGLNRKDVLDSLLNKQQKELMKQMTTFPSVIRTEYAYALLAERDTAKAEKILERFEKNVETFPYPSEIETEREMLEIAQQHFVPDEAEEEPAREQTEQEPAGNE